MARKVLIAFHDGQAANVTTQEAVRCVDSLLWRMGYDADTSAISEPSAQAALFETDAQGYEFIVWVRLTGGIVVGSDRAVMLSGDAVIPTFVVMPLDDSSNTAALVVGVSRDNTWSSHYKWISHTDGGEWPANTAEYSESTNFQSGEWQVITTIQDATSSPSDGGVQFNAAYRADGTSPIYFEAGGPAGFNLPILLSEAITNGHISAPDKKAFATQDLDDIPNANTTLTDITNVYTKQTASSIPIAWGIHANLMEENADHENIWDFVRPKTGEKGGLIFPIEHVGNDYWSDSFANITSFYAANIASMLVKTIPQGANSGGTDSWGYHYFNTNRITDDGLRVCEINNFSVVRFDNSVKSGQPVGYDGKSLWVGTNGPSTGRELSISRDMLVVDGNNFIASNDENLDRDTDIAKFANHVGTAFLIDGCCSGGVSYMHGRNFQSTGGGNAPGLLAMQSMSDIVSRSSNVLEWAFPTRLMEMYNTATGLALTGPLTFDLTFDLTSDLTG